jgi:hypothetical protein
MTPSGRFESRFGLQLLLLFYSMLQTLQFITIAILWPLNKSYYHYEKSEILSPNLFVGSRNKRKQPLFWMTIRLLSPHWITITGSLPTGKVLSVTNCLAASEIPYQTLTNELQPSLGEDPAGAVGGRAMVQIMEVTWCMPISKL